MSINPAKFCMNTFRTLYCVKLATLIAIFGLSGLAWAGSVLVTYRLYGSTDGMVFNTLQELISHYNSLQDNNLQQCRNSPNQFGEYNCTVIFIVNSVPQIESFGSTNEIPHRYSLERESYNERRNSAGAVTIFRNASGGLGAAVDIRCPPNYHSFTTGQFPSFELECRKTCAYGETYDVKLLECTKPPQKCPQNPVGGNPVELSTGRKLQNFIDYQESHLLFSRTIYQNDVGAKWHFSVSDRALIETSLPDLTYIRYEINGRSRFLKKVDNICWRGAGESCAMVTFLPENHIRIQEGSAVSEFDRDGRKVAQFLVGDAASLVQYTYSDDAILVTNGTQTATALIENGKITSLVTPTGTIDYNYNSDGLLIGVNFPGGGFEYYRYTQDESPLLIELGRNDQPFAFWSYDSLNRVTRSWHQGNFDSVSFSYSTNYVTTTNPLGKKTQYNFIQLSDTRIVQSVAGEPSPNCAAANKEYTYYPNGTLQSKTDWSGNVTSYIRDSFGRETSRTEADDTPAARIITTEYHPTLNLPVRITEPGLITEMTYDAEGRLLNTKKTAATAP